MSVRGSNLPWGKRVEGMWASLKRSKYFKSPRNRWEFRLQEENRQSLDSGSPNSPNGFGGSTVVGTSHLRVESRETCRGTTPSSKVKSQPSSVWSGPTKWTLNLERLQDP